MAHGSRPTRPEPIARLSPTARPVDHSCRILAQGGTGESNEVINLIVTHGRGNPEVLGDPPAFKVWIYGDPGTSAIYTLTASSFYGPDC